MASMTSVSTPPTAFLKDSGSDLRSSEALRSLRLVLGDLIFCGQLLQRRPGVHIVVPATRPAWMRACDKNRHHSPHAASLPTFHRRTVHSAWSQDKVTGCFYPDIHGSLFSRSPFCHFSDFPPMACSDCENSPPMACKDEQSLQAMVGKSGEAELQSVLTLA